MNLKVRRDTHRINQKIGRVAARHHRARSATASQIIPPIRIGTKGEPISIVDSVVGAVLLAIALELISAVLGTDPTSL